MESVVLDCSKWDLSYVDFLPEIIKSGGFLSNPVYTRFEYVCWFCLVSEENVLLLTYLPTYLLYFFIY